MKRKLLLFFLLLITVSSVSAKGRLQLLGTKTVKFKGEKDTIVVSQDGGKFRKIGFKVERNTVAIVRLIVVYGNGERDEIPVKYIFKPGDKSRIIDLKGKRRNIKRITFFYKSVGRKKKGKALVKVFGIH